MELFMIKPGDTVIFAKVVNIATILSLTSCGLYIVKPGCTNATYLFEREKVIYRSRDRYWKVHGMVHTRSLQHNYRVCHP